MTDNGKTQLRLYVAGNAPNSVKARKNLSSALESVDPLSYELEIIDCLSDPARTLADGIVVTPTLLKISPQPPSTVIGTLGDSDSLRAAIGLSGHV